MRVGNLGGFGNTGVTALCDFLEDTASIYGFLPKFHEAGYVKSDISFFSLMQIAEHGIAANTPNYSLIDLFDSLIGDIGSKAFHYEQKGFNEQGHLENRADMQRFIPRHRLASIIQDSLRQLGILDPNMNQRVMAVVREVDIIAAFNTFTSSIVDELTSGNGPYSANKVRSLFFKNDPPAAFPDLSSKFHDYSIFICRPPCDTTYDLLRHYKMEISDTNIDWHITSYRSMIESFLLRADRIPKENLLDTIRLIEFPVFVNSPKARLELISFILQDAMNNDSLIYNIDSQPERKFNPKDSAKNIGHGANLPIQMRQRIEVELDPVYQELLEYCAKRDILVHA